MRLIKRKPETSEIANYAVNGIWSIVLSNRSDINLFLIICKLFSRPGFLGALSAILMLNYGDKCSHFPYKVARSNFRCSWEIYDIVIQQRRMANSLVCRAFHLTTVIKLSVVNWMFSSVSEISQEFFHRTTNFSKKKLWLSIIFIVTWRFESASSILCDLVIWYSLLD